MDSVPSMTAIQCLKWGSFLSAKSLTRIGTWNVRTLYQCGKLEQVLQEFKNYNMDILGLSEVRWTGSGKFNDSVNTVIYSGHVDQHVHGVGLILSENASRALIGWKPVSDRIITARFQSRHTKATVIQVYAPTENAEEAVKDDFYDQLQATLSEIPSHDLKLLIGDLNAQICSDRRGHEHVIGPHGSATETNDNGDRLLMFCGINGLCIGNSYFAHKSIHKKTWRSPDGKTMNEIDYICISRRWRSAVTDVRVFRGADVASDHYLLLSSIRLRLKQIPKQKHIKPFAVEKLKNEDVAGTFKLELQNRFQLLDEQSELEEKWSQFQEVLTEVAEETIGRRRGTKKKQWISDRTWKLIDDRKTVKCRRDQALTSEKLEEAAVKYQELDRQVKAKCREDKKIWLEGKAREAQQAASKNDTRALFKIVQDLSGSRVNNNVPIKDKTGKTLFGQKEQDARWVEHFKETLNQPRPTPVLSPNGHSSMVLNVNMGPITSTEVEEAIRALKHNKAPGLDQISAELLKYGGTAVVQRLVELLNECWKNERVPDDWRKGVIIKLPKKGNLSDCNNWRGITLLSVPGKVLCTILLRRLHDEIDKCLREEQAGFRRGRSCSEQIFTLRNIIEQSSEFQQAVIINFIDFKKAFDSVDRESLWNILQTYGIPQHYINIFRNLYTNSRCCVKTENGTTDFFTIETGVRQGCILSPFLFLLAIDYIMKNSMSDQNFGIGWINQRKLTDLDFADDIALLAESSSQLKEMTTALEQEAAKVGLMISDTKTKLMRVGEEQHNTPVHVGCKPVEFVEHFNYLGSMVDADGGTDRDVQSRIGRATAVFQKMRSVWSTSAISTSLKVKLFNAIVIPTAIYACESWKATSSISHKLNVFQQRCLRKILNVSYKDHVRNEEILRRCSSQRLSATVTERRMRFAGHVLRMPEHRHARAVMNWTPPEGHRKRGRPRTTWRRTFCKDLKTINIEWKDAETTAADRTRWRKLVAQCAQHGT